MSPRFRRGSGESGAGQGAGGTIPGRGVGANPANRFESIVRIPEPPDDDRAATDTNPPPRTEFLPDASRTVIARNASPDIGFDASINPYRGCEHGCAYCYARPTHEYLGFSAGLDFETRIMVKHDAPDLLRRELSAQNWLPQRVAMSGVTDCYQPIERKLGLTRRCLEVLAEFRNPVTIITKNHLVTRDIDLLADLARYQAAAVAISLTTLDSELCGVLEPRTSRPERRLAAIERLAAAGIPVGVMIAPVIPVLTEPEIPALLAAAAAAGARYAGYGLLRLPHAVASLFSDWLQRHAPNQKDKVLARIRALHGGELYAARFGARQRGEGPFAEQIEGLFRLGCRRAGLAADWPVLSTAHFRRPGGQQLALL